MKNIFEEIASIFSTIDVSSALLILGILIGLAGIGIAKSTKSKYNEKLKIIEIDNIRSNYENKIYDLTEKLTFEKNRWIDSNHIFANMPNDTRIVNNLIQPIDYQYFFNSMGIETQELEVIKKSIFVLTPFNNRYINEYKVIKHSCLEIGVSVSRGDEERIETDIISYIVKKICSAQLIIANISGRNPNVFYELGIAQAIGKPTIIVSKGASDIPFDLKNRQVIIYKDNADLQAKIKKAIVNAL